MTNDASNDTATTTVRPSEIHRRLVESYDEILAGQVDDALALIDLDVIDHRGGSQGDQHGRDAWRQKWEHLSDNRFHDISVKIEQNVEEGDISVNRYTSRGIHSASGRSYEVLSMDMVRVRDGKVVEHWALRDSNAIRHQLGLDKDA